MLLSSFFTRSMAFTHTPKVQLPFALFSETFLTIRQNSLYVTVCIIARPSYRGYFIHSLSTLHYCNAPSLATRLTGDYRDATCCTYRYQQGFENELTVEDLLHQFEKVSGQEFANDKALLS